MAEAPGIRITHGEGTIRFVLTDPQPVLNETETRTLHPNEGLATLWHDQGAWTVGRVTLFGRWEKKDGTPGSNKGQVGYSHPLDKDSEATAWLKDLLDALVGRFNAAQLNET